MDEPRPRAYFARLSFWFGLTWWLIAGSIYAWSYLTVTDLTGAMIVGYLLVLGWLITGPFAIVFWLGSVVGGENRRRGWWLAWTGLLLALSGPVQFVILSLL